MAEPIPLEVIPFQENFQELFVDIFKDAAETDASLGDDSGYSAESSSLPSAPPANPDYYIYDKQSYDQSYAVPQAKNLFGANLDVVATLGDEDNIQFEAMGDSSLRNAIAYIVPWQRASSSSRIQSASSAVNAPRTNFFQGVIDGLSPDFGFAKPGYFDSISDDIDTSFTPYWDETKSSWDTDIDYFNTDLDFFVGNDFKGNLNSEYYTKILNTDTEDQATLDQSAAEKRQAAVSSEIPMGWRQGILAGGRFLASELIEDTGTRGLVDTALTQGAGLLNTPTGPVYIGNANGLVNQVLDIATIFGVNVPRGLTTSIPPNLQSNRSKLEGFAAKAKPTNGMWQFLFNPSEIALSTGPKFKTTETWGVSDEANSGQPLHWTNNSNTKLQFSKVLLNGYIFGKKVESLEQGLFKLFLENPTNDAKHGPKVLEFVWGKRSFGPCVIKDIRVNEKMWDEGCLVSAEVSFTLEKVPEWTINDGQVSTFDPTAHPVSASPTKTTSEEARTAEEREQTAPPPSEPTAQSPGLTAEEQTLYRNCQDALNEAANFGKMRAQMDAWGNVFIGNSKSTKREIRAMAAKYEKLYNKMASKYGRDFVGKITNPTAKPALLKKQVTEGLAAFPQFSETDLPIGGQYNSVAKIVYSAANSGNIAMKAISDSKKCRDIRTKNDNINKARAATAKEKKRCDGLKPGAACSPPGSIGQTCGGARLVCARTSKWQAA